MQRCKVRQSIERFAVHELKLLLTTSNPNSITNDTKLKHHIPQFLMGRDDFLLLSLGSKREYNKKK